MSKITDAVSDFTAMDELSDGSSYYHKIHPLIKLILTVLYIILTLSFDKYNLSGIIVMVLIPVFLYQLSGIKISTCFSKLKLIIPLVIFVGIFNPFFDKIPVFTLGRITVTTGVLSMLTLMLKGIFALMMSFLLMATTKMDSLCSALRLIHVPQILVTLLLLTYRYISVMIDEVAIMSDAYSLRAPGQNGIHISAWGSFLGQLLLRSMDRAEELYYSMQLRGFKGEFTYADNKRPVYKDYIFLLIMCLVLVVFRYVNIANVLGGLFI